MQPRTVALHCFTLLVSTALQNESYIYIYIPSFFGFPFHAGQHSELSRVPCAIQYVLISYLFYLLSLLRCSVVSDSVMSWTVARQSPLSIGFSWQEYWSGMPFLPPGDLSDPGIKPKSPALAGRFFTTSTTWETLSSLGIVSVVCMSQSQ